MGSYFTTKLLDSTLCTGRGCHGETGQGFPPIPLLSKTYLHAEALIQNKQPQTQNPQTWRGFLFFHSSDLVKLSSTANQDKLFQSSFVKKIRIMKMQDLLISICKFWGVFQEKKQFFKEKEPLNITIQFLFILGTALIGSLLQQLLFQFIYFEIIS